MIEVIVAFLIPVVVGAGTWLVKTFLPKIVDRIVQQRFAQEIESFKARLERENSEHAHRLTAIHEVELERVKTALVVASREHEIRYERTFVRRAEILERAWFLSSRSILLANRLVKTLEFDAQLGRPRNVDELRKNVVALQKALQRTSSHIDRHFLYFDVETVERIQLAMRAMSEIVPLDPRQMDENWFAQLSQRWEVARDGIQNAMIEVRKDLRLTLGLEAPQPGTALGFRSP
jgi:hypothetical protein